jgi:hypothetical protein
MSFIILRGCWFHIDIVLNVHVPTEDEIDDMKDTSMWNWNIYSINSPNTI